MGYGEHPPRIRWQGDAKVAVQIVVNYEEGTEKTFAMGDGENDILHEIPFKLDGVRDLAVESVYEYGSRAGIWRLFRVFDAAGIPVTFFGVAAALERNPAVARKLAARGDECASHGYRWSNGFEMTRDEEREAIRRAVASIEADDRQPAARLVLARDERQHARARGRGGRLRLRLRVLQRRPAVLDDGARQGASRRAVLARRQRRPLRAGAGLRLAGALPRVRHRVRCAACGPTATTCRA